MRALGQVETFPLSGFLAFSSDCRISFPFLPFLNKHTQPAAESERHVKFGSGGRELGGNEACAVLSPTEEAHGCLACLLVSASSGHICVLYIDTLWFDQTSVVLESPAGSSVGVAS